MVIAEKSTEGLAANRGAGTRESDAVDQFVAEPLMVALAVIVNHELRESMPQVPLTERYEAVQALLFDRPNKPRPTKFSDTTGLRLTPSIARWIEVPSTEAPRPPRSQRAAQPHSPLVFPQSPQVSLHRQLT